MKKISMLAMALVIGLSSTAFAWSGHGGGHRSGHSFSEHGSFARNNNIPFAQHGGGHEYAPDNRAIHEAEMKDPNHNDVTDITAPHRKSANCDGMTGPHGRHITGE